MKRKSKRRQRRPRPIERVKLVRRDHIDPDWQIPIDVQLTTNGAITNVLAGCTIATLVEALRARQ